MAKALLVIDVQNGVYHAGETVVARGPAVLAAINELIGAARGAGMPVAFVQHADYELVEGSDDFDIVDALDVRDADIRVIKHHGSAFHDTDLLARLTSRGVDEVIVCGLQSEYCVDSTLRHARVLGLPVTLVSDAHTTFDTAGISADLIVAHHNRIHVSYATVAATERVVRDIVG